MKKILNFIEEEFTSILITIFLLLLIVFGIICEYRLSKTDIFDLEEKCFTFYKENNYILEECSRYKNKLIIYEN